MTDRDAQKNRIMRRDASALRTLFGPLREVSLDEICGVPIESECSESALRLRLAGPSFDRSREALTSVAGGDRCDGCRRAVPLVCSLEMRTEATRARRRYCAECARLIGDWKPPTHDSA
jgi:hypothetical protein